MFGNFFHQLRTFPSARLGYRQHWRPALAEFDGDSGENTPNWISAVESVVKVVFILFRDRFRLCCFQQIQ